MVDLNTENFIQPLTLAMSSAISEMINEIDLDTLNAQVRDVDGGNWKSSKERL